MFKVTYPDGNVIKKIFIGVLRPLDEAPIRVDNEKFLVRALSPDKNVLVEALIPASAFDLFDVGEETTVTADRDQLLKQIRKATKRDTVTLSYERGARYVLLTLQNTRTGSERTYQIEITEAGRELVESINLDLPVQFQILSEDFKKLIRDVKLVGDELELTYKEGTLEASCRAENKLFKQTLTKDNPLLTLNSKESMVASKYDVDLIKSVSAAFDVADLVNVEFGAGLPMKIYLGLEDGTKLTFWIAPRT